MEYADKYITPTQKSPVFMASCDYFGYIEVPLYKEWAIATLDNCTYIGSTFALTFATAVKRLHEWIVENPQIIAEYPKCKFTIECVDGSPSRFNDPKHETVYTISAKKAARFLF
jgi:hypothetical protein